MGFEKYFPDDVVGKKATAEQKSKRLKEFEYWFDCYVKGIRSVQGALGSAGYKEPGNFQFDPDAAKVVNEVYWELLEERVRPRIVSCKGDIEVTVDRHKISSLTELVIVHAEPIDHDDARTKRRFNASLAYFCGLNIMANWNPKVASEMYVSRSFSEAHTTWLEYLPATNEERMPIFSNAANWYLVETIFEERFNKKLVAPT